MSCYLNKLNRAILNGRTWLNLEHLDFNTIECEEFYWNRHHIVIWFEGWDLGSSVSIHYMDSKDQLQKMREVCFDDIELRNKFQQLLREIESTVSKLPKSESIPLWKCYGSQKGGGFTGKEWLYMCSCIDGFLRVRFKRHLRSWSTVTAVGEEDLYKYNNVSEKTIYKADEYTSDEDL
jgi:hypothetical protein